MLDVALLDNFCVFFDLSITPNIVTGSAVVEKRCINENTRTLFMEAIKFEIAPISNHVDDHVDHVDKIPHL